MKLLRGIHKINAEHKNCVLKIGVGFNLSDGIHLEFFVFTAFQEVVN